LVGAKRVGELPKDCALKLCVVRLNRKATFLKLAIGPASVFSGLAGLKRAQVLEASDAFHSEPLQAILNDRKERHIGKLELPSGGGVALGGGERSGIANGVRVPRVAGRKWHEITAERRFLGYSIHRNCRKSPVGAGKSPPPGKSSSSQLKSYA
jgi:hypothetical protein